MTRVFMHVGAPKTGTTYLQDVLFGNRERLRAAGVLYPGDTADAHFRATLDLRGLSFRGYDDPRTEGAWTHLRGRVRDWSGSAVVVSHELLGGARPETIDALLGDFEGCEVHVVCTARDLGRQVPAVWQEMVKNRQTLGYRSYLAQVTGQRTGRGARVFWRQQDVAEVLARWGERVPAERIHLVTVPPPGAPSRLLWERFCAVLGIDPGAYETAVPRRNASIGLAEAELLRRVNATLDDRLDWPEFAALVKGGLAEQLAARTSTVRARVPDELRPWFEQAAAEMVAALRAGGYDVVGDLADLTPAFGEPGAGDTAEPDTVVDAAASVLAELLVQRAERRHRRRSPVVASLSARLRGDWRRRARAMLPARLAARLRAR